MPRTRRRLLGAAIAAALLLAAGGGTALLRKARAQARRNEVAEAVEASRARAQDALRAQLAVVEGRAASGASNPVLRAQLGVVDAATLKDGFASESWWDAVRREFPVSGVAAGETPEVLVGLDPQSLDFSGLIRAARKAGQAATLLATPKGSPLVAGAAMAEGRAGSRFAVLVAKPMDGAFAEQIATRTRGAALVSDGKRALLSAGPADGQLNLKSAVGSEASGTFSGQGWAAAATPLSLGLWLWTEASLRPLPPGPPVDLIVLWSVAGLGAIGALAFAFRRPPVPPTQPEMEAATLPSAGVVSVPARPIRSNPGQTGSTRRTNPGGRGTDSGADRRAVHPIERPNQFGRYTLIDRLGEGGMAEVYTAVAFGAENFRRAFVIKLLHSTAQRTESLVNMFIDEAKLAASLVHGNIIPVYDFGKVGDEYFMAQEYVLGRDLRRLVAAAMKKDGKPLDAKLSVYIVREGLRALEYAHTRLTDDGRPMGIVHRDVSPNNILVSARGEVKLLDFGIAKRDEGRLHQTQTGVVKGNVQYMAPEQARGEPVDARADVCAMGLVLYFLLTGRSLYRGDNAYNLLIQAAQGLNQELIGALQAIPAPLAAILRVALEPDREQRFQSAAAFDNALSQAPAATGTDLARHMQRLFGEELKAEQARFASVQPPEEPPPEEGTGEAGAF
jgi:serine/threonine protein kinase